MPLQSIPLDRLYYHITSNAHHTKQDLEVSWIRERKVLKKKGTVGYCGDSYFEFIVRTNMGREVFMVDYGDVKFMVVRTPKLQRLLRRNTHEDQG